MDTIFDYLVLVLFIYHLDLRLYFVINKTYGAIM